MDIQVQQYLIIFNKYKTNYINNIISVQYLLKTIKVKYLSIHTQSMKLSQKPQQQVINLLIFLLTVINQIYLLSLIVIILKKIKYIIKSTAKKYYYFIMFYIVSKLAICILIQIQIMVINNDVLAKQESNMIQKIFDNSILLADCSILELFLVVFQYYLGLLFIVSGNKRMEEFIKTIMQLIQIIIFLTLIIPTLLFNIGVIYNFSTLNLFTMCLNSLCVVIFIFAFFIVNFKMTGIMMHRRTSQIIKKIYKLLLLLLFSRILIAVIQVFVQIHVPNCNFTDFINKIQQNNSKQIVLGCCFIFYLLIVFLSQVLPLTFSLRQSLIMVFAETITKPSLPNSLQQTLITSSNNAIKQQLLNNLDFDDQIYQQRMPAAQNLLQNYHGVSRIQNPEELQIVQKLIFVRQDFIFYKAIWKKTGKLYFVKRLTNISNYIIQQIINQIEIYSKLSTKVINPLKILYKNTEGQIFIIEKYLPQNLFRIIDKIVMEPLKQKIKFSIKIAKALKQFQEATKRGHGVINPKNIMFDDNQNIILTGFGMQSLKKYLALTTQYTNITIYTAVELFGTVRQKTISKPTKSADVYSFGIIFYQIITGNFKYRKLNLTQIRNKFQKQNTRPKIPEQICDDIKKIMRKCWQQNPKHRPTFSTIIQNLETIKSIL